MIIRRTKHGIGRGALTLLVNANQCESQCDQIWQNYATLAKSLKYWANFEGVFNFWHNLKCSWANCICLWATLY